MIEKKVFDLLEKLNIKYDLHHHEPTYKVSDAPDLRAKIAGAHTKNLFLTDHFGAYFLVIMMGEDRLHIGTLHKELGCKRLSFCKEETLLEFLGVPAGSVTPFAVMHDPEKRVQVILDKEMMTHEYANYHPLRNDMTLTIKTQDLYTFFDHTGHHPLVMTLPKILFG